ncbi:hypothetical protein NSK_006329 [Nannochloropsis salina CCMP1776]|uniref:Uncharacterized protein n=1 Tax=Nannochloropsis salina CCMP1776 TaxID=1027361 RepID=A0A4D9CU09_9STRA|nr:hypothetical protein NSK_006329 [Nannochloropsis salina CCMP1776]|eukprot:TFJ82356.1 hypothetical protein NSK_006329 [Nannochloropsis salina CCMP1776]
MIRRIKAGTFDFFRDSLPSMLETVTKREARQIFEQFPFMKTTNVWKKFIETGEAADEDAAAAAMVEAVREMGAILIEARSITKDADTVVQHANDFLDDLKANDASSPELVASAKRGSPRAIATLQQKFANQYLGGIDLETFQNPQWVDRARENFFADENLLRAVGDESVLSNLRNPNLRPLKVSEYEEADPSRILSSLTGN